MAQKLHIVYDVSYPSVEGGGQKRIYEIAKRLARQGWAIKWFTFKTWEGSASIERDGVVYVGLGGYVSLYAADGRRSWREAIAFGRAVWTHRYVIRDADVVWCGQWPYSHLLTLMFRTRARFFVDWWEIWGRYWFEYFGRIRGCIGYFSERTFATLCSRRGRIITISLRGARDIVESGAKSESVVMIPNGIDIQSVDVVSPSNQSADIIYVGRLKDHKNVDHIIRALHLLRIGYGLTLHVDIVGSGPQESALRSLTTELGLASQVRFVGSVGDDEKYARMKSASLFVHPSTKEGGGSLTILEAYACGIPVMIYNAPQGIDPEYIVEGKTGWIVNQVSPEILAKQLADLFNEQRTLLCSRKNDCRTAVLPHDWDKIADRYHDLFSSVQ